MWFSPTNYRPESMDIEKSCFARLRHEFNHDFGSLCPKESLWKGNYSSPSPC